MAKLLSHILSDVTGKLAGARFKKGKSDQILISPRYFQHRTQTNAQQTHNSWFSGANRQWKNMSEAYRQGWKDFAKTCTRPDNLHLTPDAGRLLWISTYMMMKRTYKPEGYTNDLSLEPPIRKGKIKPELLVLETPTALVDRYRWRFNGNDTEAYGLYLFASNPSPGWTLHGSDTYPAGYITRVQVDPSSTRNLVWNSFSRNSTYNIEIKGVSIYGKHRLTSVMRFRLHTPAAF